MLITALEKEKQQIYHNGHIEGKREGRIVGSFNSSVGGISQSRHFAL